MSETLSRLTAAIADKYTIERELGQGGMATVYLAEDLRHQRKVAVKVVHPELAAVLGAERFLSEIHVTAALQHQEATAIFTLAARAIRLGAHCFTPRQRSFRRHCRPTGAGLPLAPMNQGAPRFTCGPSPTSVALAGKSRERVEPSPCGQRMAVSCSIVPQRINW